MVEEAPIDSNKTRAGRSNNRRVEVKVSNLIPELNKKVKSLINLMRLFLVKNFFKFKQKKVPLPLEIERVYPI